MYTGLLHSIIIRKKLNRINERLGRQCCEAEPVGLKQKAMLELFLYTGAVSQKIFHKVRIRIGFIAAFGDDHDPEPICPARVKFRS